MSVPHSTCGGLALPPRQVPVPARAAVALPPKADNRIKIAVGIAGAAVAFGAIRRAVVARGSA